MQKRPAINKLITRNHWCGTLGTIQVMVEHFAKVLMSKFKSKQIKFATNNVADQTGPRTNHKRTRLWSSITQHTLVVIFLKMLNRDVLGMIQNMRPLWSSEVSKLIGRCSYNRLIYLLQYSPSRVRLKGVWTYLFEIHPFQLEDKSIIKVELKGHRYNTMFKHQLSQKA